MTDELDVVHVVLFVPVNFERKNRQQEIDVAFDPVHAARAPCPELRADVINDFQTATVQRRSESEVELGPVDEDHGVRCAFDCYGFELAKGFEEFREDASDFDDAHDRELVGVDDCLDAGVAQQRTGGAEKIKLATFAQCFHERGRVRITGRLTGDDHQRVALLHGADNSRRYRSDRTCKTYRTYTVFMLAS